MRRLSTVGVLVAAFVTLAAPAAVATSFSGSMTGSRVSGHVTISTTTASISGTAWDTKSDGECATLRGNWDIPLRPDHGFDVAKACGNGTHRTGTSSSGVDRGARDFEVRTKTGDSYKVVWEGDNGDA